MNDIQKPIHLVKAITEQTGFETAVYCTYSIDLAFFEEAILHPLRVNGCRRHIIFVDAARYADTLRDLRDTTQRVGKRYLLIPVHMPPYQSFHSKMVLLLGAEQGRLLLGSGNLTFTGFGHNHELYTCIDWSPDQQETLPVFQAVWQFIQQIQKAYGHAKAVDKIFQKTNYIAYWLHQGLSENNETVPQFHHTLTTNLLEQLSSVIASEPVYRLTIITPFLDKQLAALKELNQRFSPESIRLILQDQEAVGNTALLADLQKQGIPLQIYRFSDDTRYLHAKLMLLETEKGAYLLSGSPNCTRSAILSTPANGNIETAFLRHAQPPDYFNYLIDHLVLRENEIPPEQLTLRDGRMLGVESRETEQDKHFGSIRLLDASVQGDKIHFTYTLDGITAEDTFTTQLKFAPNIYYLSLEPLEPGTHEIELQDSAETVNKILGMETAVSVRLVISMSGESHTLVQSNELWLAYLDELAAREKAHHDVGRATDFLTRMVADSENDWKDLYAEISRLVSLDVTQVSKRAKVYAVSNKLKASTQKESVEKETDITLAAEEMPQNTLGLSETELTAAAVIQDDNLQAFFDHVRRRLPGKPATDSSTASSPTSTIRVTPTSWSGERRIRARFINLVRKYINSLQNPEFMSPSLVPYNLKYFVIFHRLVHLILSHELIDEITYLKLIQDLNSSFFGEPANSTPPAKQSRICHHLRYAWSEQWLSDDVDLYALASLLKAIDIRKRIEDEKNETPLQQLWLQVLAGVLTVISLPTLLDRVETLEPLEDVAFVHQQDPSAMAMVLLERIQTDLPQVITIFEDWSRKVAFDSHDALGIDEIGLLYQANVDYRRALFFIYSFLGETDKQINLGRELIFWSHRAGDESESKQWGARVIEIYRQQGDSEEIALALYHQANKLMLAKDYNVAIQLLQEALSLLPQESAYTRKCTHLLSNIAFLNRQATW